MAPGDDDENVVPFDPIRSAIEEASEVKPDPPERKEPGRGGKRKRVPKPGESGLPEDCPVTVLGQYDLDHSYLHPKGQIFTLSFDKHTGASIEGLFAGHRDWMRKYYPRYGKGVDSNGKPQINGIRYNDLGAALMHVSAYERPVFNPAERVRARGWWFGPDGELVIHCGDAVLVVDKEGREVWHQPGLHGEHVYKVTRCGPRPLAAEAGTAEAGELLGLLGHWVWTRPDVDPILLIGWIGCAILGASIKWRPVMWITGGSGTGKSTIKDAILVPLLGEGGSIPVSDATEAGLRQSLREESLPVICDELEAETDNRKADAIIRLARLAAGGGEVRRGGQDHSEHVFHVFSAFLFQSILVPPMLAQDTNRLAVLELMPLGERRMPAISPGRLAYIGSVIRRRLIQAWPRLSETMSRYQETMRAEGARGMDARGADVYGALMAVAEVLLYDDPEEADQAFRLIPEVLRAQVYQQREGATEEDRFLGHLLSCSVETSRGSQPVTVATLIRRAAGRTGDVEEAHRAKQALGVRGIYVGPYTKDIPDALGVVLANSSAGLADLLRGTRWTAEAGRDAPWAQICKRLAQAHDGVATPKRSWRFSGVTQRGAWVPLGVFIPEDDRG